MSVLPHDGVALIMVVFMLGLQHGVDPDHIATIDGLTKFNAKLRPRVSRWSGVLFSAGHGLIVTAVAAMVAVYATEWAPPTWLEHLGAWISIVFLLVLGGVNLHAFIRSPKDQPLRIVGFKGRWLARFSRTSHPVLIATVGAAFALSFDTISQAALFSLAASKLSGWMFAVALGLVFMAGMMVADGLNGFWIGRLIRRADSRAIAISRIMGLVIGALSVAIAFLGIAKYFSPVTAAFLDGAGLLVGIFLAICVPVIFALALRFASTQKVVAGQSA
jgi:nickel/cobalt transporter (NiCoT) family protein